MMNTKKRNTTLTGRKGEEYAALYLAKKGFFLLNKNFLCQWGEIDLIMLKNKTLHYVEVKTWRLGLENLEFSISSTKKARLHNSALYYQDSHCLNDFGMSFDLFYIKNAYQRKVIYIPNAF